LKDLSIADLIGEYFVLVNAKTLSQETKSNFISFLLEMAEEKPYRNKLINKGIFTFMRDTFMDKECPKKMKSDIGKVTGFIMISSLAWCAQN